MTTEPLTITIGGPNSDRVLTAITHASKQLSMHPSEVVALLLGLGMRTALEQGLLTSLPDRMPRSELLRQMADMVAEAEEFET